jgi:hypothetical protein
MYSNVSLSGGFFGFGFVPIGRASPNANARKTRDERGMQIMTVSSNGDWNGCEPNDIDFTRCNATPRAPAVFGPYFALSAYFFCALRMGPATSGWVQFYAMRIFPTPQTWDPFL